MNEFIIYELTEKNMLLETKYNELSEKVNLMGSEIIILKARLDGRDVFKQ